MTVTELITELQKIKEPEKVKVFSMDKYGKLQDTVEAFQRDVCYFLGNYMPVDQAERNLDEMKAKGAKWKGEKVNAFLIIGVE